MLMAPNTAEGEAERMLATVHTCNIQLLLDLLFSVEMNNRKDEREIKRDTNALGAQRKMSEITAVSQSITVATLAFFQSIFLTRPTLICTSLSLKWQVSLSLQLIPGRSLLYELVISDQDHQSSQVLSCRLSSCSSQLQI